jgi:hypothetical protein
MTWFRRMEREGVEIHWIEGMLAMEEKVRKALEYYQSDQDNTTSGKYFIFIISL